MTQGPGSVVGIATSYELDGPGIESRWGARFPAPVQTGFGAHPASCTIGTVSFLGIKSGRGVTRTPHPLLVPWPWKSRAIPLLPVWSVRLVQSLSACTWVQFTLFYIPWHSVAEFLAVSLSWTQDHLLWHLLGSHMVNCYLPTVGQQIATACPTLEPTAVCWTCRNGLAYAKPFLHSSYEDRH
jgi:hypothetical protein